MNVLFLSYTGLAEPLGVSQVLSYLVRLSASHRITLVTFEKANDLTDQPLMQSRRAACEAAGIRWVPLRYHKRPRLLATGYDLARLALTGWREARRIDADLIHARAYIAGFVSLALGAVLRRPFIFDTRAFWPEELIASGRLRRGSRLHRLIAAGERLAFRRAAGVVFLTRAAVTHLNAVDPSLLARADVVSIPTCADLDRFRPVPERRTGRLHRIVSAGSLLSGWFRADLLFRFLAAARAAQPGLEVALHTREDTGRLAAAARAEGVELAGVVTGPLDPTAVPDALAGADAVPLFYKTGLARLAGFPTRMAEALGCGVPVVVNGDSGEVAAIVAEHRVGVLVQGEDTAAMERAVADLRTLLADPDLAARCRRTAEALFSADVGAAQYDALYRRIGARA